MLTHGEGLFYGCKKTGTIVRIVRVSRAYTLRKYAYPGSTIKRKAVQFFYSALIYDKKEAQGKELFP